MTKPALSIVIPAFKVEKLGHALRSLANQSDADFEVVVADDGSPEDLQSVCAQFQPLLQLRFHRFDENLGSRSLAQHWARAVALAQHDWIWLMGDDDELEGDCVAHVRAALALEPDWPGLWRVNVKRIDANGDVVAHYPAFPPVLSAEEFVAQRCQSQIPSFACEYVFRRSELFKRGGFVDFPLAWCSDDATWVRLAGRAGIRTIAGTGAHARWRLWGASISGAGDRLALQKAEARLQYLEWLATPEVETLLHSTGQPAQQAMRRKWFLDQLHSSRVVLKVSELWSMGLRLRSSTRGTFLEAFRDLLRQQHWRKSQRKSQRKAARRQFQPSQ